MRNFLLILVLSVFISSPVVAADEQNTCPNCNVTVSPNEYDTPISAEKIMHSGKCAELVDRIFDDRAATYNVLNLTPPQRKYKREIEERRFQELDAQINVLEQEIYVLKKLQCNPEANKTAIKKQQKVIKNLKKELDKTAKKYDIDYALKKDKSTSPPTYHIFFTSSKSENFQNAFKEYAFGIEKKIKNKDVTKVVNREQIKRNAKAISDKLASKSKEKHLNKSEVAR